MTRGTRDQSPNSEFTRRVMLLTTTTGYQARSFAEAAQRLGVELVFGSDRCHVLEDPWRDGALSLRFEDPEKAAKRLLDFAREKPLDGIVAVGDCTPPVAARACRDLGLPFHSVQAADGCRDKYRSRILLRDAGLQVPNFRRFSTSDRPETLLAEVESHLGWPVVLKPLTLSASRGVIRASTPEEFVHAFDRIRKLLRSAEIRGAQQGAAEYLQVESYVPGVEFAVEAVVQKGRLKTLALFDKPDPLTGPYFEETIYLTPSRLAPEAVEEIEKALDCAVRALALFDGPLHAEMRINQRGVWPLEVAARPIGGLCARALRFERGNGEGAISLEELLLRLALGESVADFARETAASGVMMIPIGEGGVYEATEGLEAARDVPSVEEVIITAVPGQKMVPLPEGSSYLGFIFARGDSASLVERALREAHSRLHFHFAPALPVI